MITHGSSQVVARTDGFHREADAYLTEKRVAPEPSDVPCAVPIGVSTDVWEFELWRGQRALCILGESLHSSAFQVYGGIDTCVGSAVAQDAKRRAKTRD